MIPGHEIIGHVTKVGPEAKKYKIGAYLRCGSELVCVGVVYALCFWCGWASRDFLLKASQASASELARWSSPAERTYRRVIADGSIHVCAQKLDPVNLRTPSIPPHSQPAAAMRARSRRRQCATSVPCSPTTTSTPTAAVRPPLCLSEVYVRARVGTRELLGYHSLSRSSLPQHSAHSFWQWRRAATRRTSASMNTLSSTSPPASPLRVRDASCSWLCVPCVVCVVVVCCVLYLYCTVNGCSVLWLDFDALVMLRRRASAVRRCDHLRPVQALQREARCAHPTPLTSHTRI